MAKNAKPKVKCTKCGRITKKGFSGDGRCKTCWRKEQAW